MTPVAPTLATPLDGGTTIRRQLNRVRSQRLDFSPIHFRSASSANTCAENRVMQLQDRLYFIYL